MTTTASTGRGERPVVPPAEPRSYYGQPILNQPVWKSQDIAGYIFLGGLAGASSVLAGGAQVTGRAQLAKRTKLVAAGAIGVGAAALVHDLGRPERFYHMLRVLKPTSPMSVGSWLLAAYGPAAGVAAASEVTGRWRRLGLAATAGAALLGPAVATYTAALLSSTAVPAWHEGFREMPFVFAGSSVTAAAGLALLTSPLEQTAPARRLAILGSAIEATGARLMERRAGPAAEPYKVGKAASYLRSGQALTGAGLLLAFAGRRSRTASAAAGAALATASAVTRFGIFHAGQASAADPKYTVQAQRAQRARRA